MDHTGLHKKYRFYIHDNDVNDEDGPFRVTIYSTQYTKNLDSSDKVPETEMGGFKTFKEARKYAIDTIDQLQQE
jgi:hypothetical protein